MSRSKVSGPFAGNYVAFCLKLAGQADTPSFIMPGAFRVSSVSFYARASTSGTITVTSSSPAVTIQASGALTADTATSVTGASLTNRLVNRGSIVKAAGGGSLTDGTCIITGYLTDHVVSAGPQADPND